MRRSGVALVLTGALLAAPTAAQALAPSSYVVSGTADGPVVACTPSATVGQDTCPTLRDAVNTANAQLGNPTIHLGAGNYVLGGPGGTNAPLIITTSMSIRGLGAASTQVTQTDGADEVFALPPGTTTTIADLAIEGGAKSGVNNNATLTLDADLIKGNHVTGLAGSGFTSAGGGIMTFHQLALIRSTVTGNTFYGADGSHQAGATAATEGSLAEAGGIFSAGTSLLIRESTISGNMAVGGHGGNGSTLRGGGGGSAVAAGIYASAGTTTIVNSTIAGNVAQGGAPGTSPAGNGPLAETAGGAMALGSAGATTLQNDTIADNVASEANGASADAGNVFFYGGSAAPLINDTIIARGQAGPSTPARANCDFGLTTAMAGSAHNLEDTAAGASGCGLPASGGNLFVAPGASGLAPSLAYNGGLSDTIALLAGSPALAAGGTCLDPASSPPGGPLTIDERSLPRATAQPCDIGAFQAQPVALIQGASASQSGGVLRCVAAFRGESFSLAYAWLRDGVVIPGATGAVYVATTRDTGRSVGCRASATGPRNSASTQSAAVIVQGTPVLSRVKQSAARWRRGSALPHAAGRRRSRPPVGTVYTFTLNEAAQVTLTFTAPGRRVGRRCVAQTTGNHRHRACTLTKGSLSYSLTRGARRISFAGRLSRHKRLSPGRYTVVLSATSGRYHSRATSLSFTITS